MQNPLSIRTLAALIVALPIIAISAILVTLSSVTGYRIADALGRSLLETAVEQVAAQVRMYLGGAVRTSDLYARRLADRTLPHDGLTDWEPTLLQDLDVFPDIASVCFGNAQGDATWLLRGPEGLEVGRVVGGQNDRAVESRMLPSGKVVEPPLKVHHYDPRERPWFHAAERARSPVWTPVYFWFGEKGVAATIGTGYTRPILASDGTLSGVLVVDVTLEAISRFIANLPIARDGEILIVDDADLLVASSGGAVTDANGQRLGLAGNPDDVVRAVAGALTRGAGAAERVSLRGEPARVIVHPIQPYPGIEWRVVALLPERAFMGEARSAQRRGVLLASVAAAGSLVLGWLLSRRISGPLEILAGHVRQLGAGDLDRRLSLRGAREMQDLSEELNRMAVQLKERIALEKSLEVAVEVQKSLLPASDPAQGGLEIVGRSRYCDAAGGDYYDFIEATGIAGGQTLIAVGDVMGHGIGAALLMASARAALRTIAAEPGGLAGAMNAVNRVLGGDARHNQFMTMLLLVIDRERGEFRWASAGHDPAMVLARDGTAFTELEGGDVPLGVMPDAEYQEYTHQGLAVGDLIFVGTDGVWESMSPSGEHYGKDRLRELLRRTQHAPCTEIAQDLQRELETFRAGAAPTDDVTFVIARVRERTPA